MFTSSECKMFEADWMKRKIENATELKIPVSSGTVVPIRCVLGYQQLSGPDAVTCTTSATFSGLEDVVCYSK